MAPLGGKLAAGAFRPVPAGRRPGPAGQGPPAGALQPQKPKAKASSSAKSKAKKQSKSKPKAKQTKKNLLNDFLARCVYFACLALAFNVTVLTFTSRDEVGKGLANLRNLTKLDLNFERGEELPASNKKKQITRCFRGLAIFQE